MPPVADCSHCENGVIGGGINGIMVAWELARAGHAVELFERDRLMGATSSASTKLLHGGLRYLEHGQLLMVREGLRERAWWLAQASQLAHPVRLVLPVYRWSRRPRWMMKIGLWLYDTWRAAPAWAITPGMTRRICPPWCPTCWGPICWADSHFSMGRWTTTPSACGRRHRQWRPGCASARRPRSSVSIPRVA